MKVLFIGGTGTISAAISRRVLELGWELTLLNRGGRNTIFEGPVKEIICNIDDEAEAAEKLKGLEFDAAADFISFTRDQAERDYRLLKGRTAQYIAISSASAYQKPLSDYRITESTPLANPFWQYSRNKIAMEEFLASRYRDDGFPVTIVRPSHTYDERTVPLGVHGRKGSFQVLKRILEGKKVIIHGDGTSLWTLTHHSDFAAGFTGLIGNIHAIGETVQITSDESLTWNQIYGIIAAALDRPLRALHVSSDFLAQAGEYDFAGGLLGDKAHSVVFDNSKLKRLVPGFYAKVRADRGLRETVNHILSHRECQVPDSEFDAWCDRLIHVQEKALEMMNRK
jgi:nucleoside-diphosphate-sugar epimerase